jgi:hypothetical protein
VAAEEGHLRSDFEELPLRLIGRQLRLGLYRRLPLIHGSLLEQRARYHSAGGYEWDGKIEGSIKKNTCQK